MKSSELIKQAIETQMPDADAVRERCMEEFHQESPRRKVAGRKAKKRAALGIVACFAAFLCFLIVPMRSDAEPFVMRLQMLLHLNQKKVSVGEMKAEAIRIPKDCEKQERNGIEYLTKGYDSLSALEQDIGKKLKVYRGISEFGEDGVLLRVVEGEYALIDILYNTSQENLSAEQADMDGKLQNLYCYITIPLSEDFSMDKMKVEDKKLGHALFDKDGNLVGFAQNEQYSLTEIYHSERLDTEVAVLERNTELNQGQMSQIRGWKYYYLYFIYQGLSYQMVCNTDLDTARSLVESIQ